MAREPKLQRRGRHTLQDPGQVGPALGHANVQRPNPYSRADRVDRGNVVIASELEVGWSQILSGPAIRGDQRRISVLTQKHVGPQIFD